MQGVISRRTLRAAEAVFRSLASALSDRQIYHGGHPRFLQSREELIATTRRFFEENTGLQSVTFFVRGGQAEFQGIPMTRIGNHGERLVAALERGRQEVLQISRDVTDAELTALVEVALAASKGGPQGVGDGLAETEDTERFRLLSRVPQGGLLALAVDSDEQKQSEALEHGIAEIEVSEATFQSVLTTYRNLLATLEQGRSVDYGVLMETTEEVVAVFGERRHVALPGSMQTYFDDFTFHHSVNVSVILTRVAAAVTSDMELLKTISLAGLLHDVGKSRVPAEILHKPARLSPSEFECLKEHPANGAEILLSIDGLHPLCVAVAFTHHMHAGGGSYPKTARALRLDWITRLISVVDVYEALIAVRPYKNGLPPKTAFEIMLEMPGLQDRLDLVKLLFDRIGPYPTGTVVELTTGERAVVVEQNPGAPYLPHVRILTDPERNLLDAPAEIDLAEPRQSASGAERLAIRRTIVVERLEDNPLEAETPVEPTSILGGALNDDESLMAREG